MTRPWCSLRRNCASQVGLLLVIARNEATKQSSTCHISFWIASRSLSSGGALRRPARNDSLKAPLGFGLGERQMIWIANILVGLVAALHVYFLVLEMLLWTKPMGL